jgi:hypothetical protein
MPSFLRDLVEISVAAAPSPVVVVPDGEAVRTETGEMTTNTLMVESEMRGDILRPLRHFRIELVPDTPCVAAEAPVPPDVGLRTRGGGYRNGTVFLITPLG